MTSDAQRRANLKYQKTRGRIVLWCDPKEKEQIESRAIQDGKSLTQWIMDIIKEKLDH